MNIKIEEALKLEQLYTGRAIWGSCISLGAGSGGATGGHVYILGASVVRSIINQRGNATCNSTFNEAICPNELEEGTVKLHMKALALQKNKEALNRHYVQFTETLQRELGVSPSHEVTSLYRDLMAELD